MCLPGLLQYQESEAIKTGCRTKASPVGSGRGRHGYGLDPEFYILKFQLLEWESPSVSQSSGLSVLET